MYLYNPGSPIKEYGPEMPYRVIAFLKKHQSVYLDKLRQLQHPVTELYVVVIIHSVIRSQIILWQITIPIKLITILNQESSKQDLALKGARAGKMRTGE